MRVQKAMFPDLAINQNRKIYVLKISMRLRPTSGSHCLVRNRTKISQRTQISHRI